MTLVYSACPVIFIELDA